MNLSDQISDHFRLTEPHRKALKKLKLETIENLLYHFPSRYGDSYDPVKISDLSPKLRVAVYGKIEKSDTGKTFRGRRPVAKITIKDDTGILKATWFGQAYIAKMFQVGDLVKLEGTVSQRKVSGLYSMANPKIEKVSDVPEHVAGSLFGNNEKEFLDPVYAESKGITSNWIHHAIQKIFKSELLDNLEDSIPNEILEKYNLPSLKTALIWVHTPKKESDALSARKRFSFEEIFYIQLQRQKQREEIKKLDSYKIEVFEKDLNKFTDKFPFELTESQNKAVKSILSDMKRGYSMSRLLEGDVGSGKTAVAAAAVYAVTKNKPGGKNYGNLQTAYMVPTEILAKQHFENFIQFFEGSGIQIGLITGSGCQKFPSKVDPKSSTKISRSQLSKWVENGEIPIVIGTHALIQKSVKFKNLALTIIDEQHRFGTEQRKKLAGKQNFAPHLLSMTATPIPRTLALTIYGDLDLTLLDQMPLGRKPIITEIVLPNKREEIYEKMRTEIESGRQAYVICPRINEPDETKATALRVKSVKAEAERLKKKVFPELNIGLVHSKMKVTDKDFVMEKFENGQTNILVATSVIEVGVNVPNATIILIEGAERFGLAQLHQLRGRVIRSSHQAYCYIFTDTQSETSINRLKSLQTAKNGFELSELDLKLRGSGELAGKKQWGISDLGMEAIKNIKMVEAARTEATDIVVRDPEMRTFPEIKKKLEQKQQIHFE